MASACATVPTLTQTQTVTTQSTSTIVSSSVSTSSPSTTVITSVGTTCLPVTTSSAASTCLTTTQTTTSTIPGSTTTIESTKTTVIPVTSVVVNTLYSTSCTALSSNSPTTSSVFTPTTSTMTSLSSSTASNGSVIVTQVTQTLTFSSPTTVTTSAGGSHNNSRTATSNLAPIIGGSVGGFVGLIGIALLVWFLLNKRRTNWDDIFEKEEDVILGNVLHKPKRDPPPDPKPKPYEYGLVGHTTVAPHMSPPSSSAGLSLSSEGATTYPPPNVTQPQQQQLGSGPTANQQTVAQQQQQQFGPSSVLNQQTLGSQPQLGSGQNQPTHGRLISFSSNGHSGASVVSAPGAFNQDPAAVGWLGPGGGRYPPGMQRSLSMSMNAQPQAQQAGQRISVFDESEVYGGILVDTPAADSSAGVPSHGHGHGHTFGQGSSAGPGPATSEYQESQPTRERRDGKGRLITTGEKPPIVHLDGDRYRAQVLSPGPSSFGNGPPAYTA